MTDAFYPRHLRRSLLEDPDLPEQVRNARYGRPVEPTAVDGGNPSLDYSRAFPERKPRPAAPPLEMPTEGPLGPALDYGRTFRAKSAEERAAGKARAAAAWQESGMQVLGGADDALRETLKAFDPALRFVEERTGVNLPRYEGLGIAKAETGAGEFIRDASRFLTAFLPAVRVLKAAGMGHKIAGPLAAGVSEALTRNPVEKSFFDFVDKHEVVRGPVYEFLGADPGDREAVRRLEHALEGAGLGKLSGMIVHTSEAILAAMIKNKTVRDLVMDVAEGVTHTGLHKLEHAGLERALGSPSPENGELP